MIDAVERGLTRLLRLPDDPHAPPGADAGVRELRPAPGELRYRLTRWSARRIAALAGLLVALAISRSLDRLLSFEGPEIRELLARLPADLVRWLDRVQAADPQLGTISLATPLIWIELTGIALFLVQIPIGLAAVRLEVRRRRYLLTGRSLRLRQGLARTDEMTLTLASVQQVAVRQGPLQRLFGIADVEVCTAGGGGGGASGESAEAGSHAESDAHRGLLRGLGDAEAVRRAILERARTPEASPPKTTSPDASTPPVVAAGRLLDEARALRALVVDGRADRA